MSLISNLVHNAYIISNWNRVDQTLLMAFGVYAFTPSPFNHRDIIVRVSALTQEFKTSTTPKFCKSRYHDQISWHYYLSHRIPFKSTYYSIKTTILPNPSSLYRSRTITPDDPSPSPHSHTHTSPLHHHYNHPSSQPTAYPYHEPLPHPLKAKPTHHSLPTTIPPFQHTTPFSNPNPFVLDDTNLSASRRNLSICGWGISINISGVTI